MLAGVRAFLLSCCSVSVAMVKSAVRCAELRHWLLTFLTLEHQRIFSVSISSFLKNRLCPDSILSIFLEAILLVARVTRKKKKA